MIGMPTDVEEEEVAEEVLSSGSSESNNVDWLDLCQEGSLSTGVTVSMEAEQSEMVSEERGETGEMASEGMGDTGEMVSKWSVRVRRSVK